MRSGIPLAGLLAWLVLLAALAVLVAVLAGVPWWVSLTIILGVAVVTAAAVQVLLRRPR